jgi:hypothetical protein
MDGADFEELTQDEFPTLVRWAASNLCPCVGLGGAANQTCAICSGTGRWFSPLSVPFHVGLIAQKAFNRAMMANTIGPGATGAASMIVDYTAPCYALMNEGDRVYDQMVLDARQSVVLPGTNLALPAGFTGLQAFVRSLDGLSIVPVTPPVPGVDGRISVAVTTTLTYASPRAYEVVKEFGSIRSFGTSLPKRWSISLLDLTVR